MAGTSKNTTSPENMQWQPVAAAKADANHKLMYGGGTACPSYSQSRTAG
jgi:hypothetical protein